MTVVNPNPRCGWCVYNEPDGRCTCEKKCDICGAEYIGHKHSKDDCIPVLKQQIKTLWDALLWADGQLGDFPERPEGSGPYWWRNELMACAALAATAARCTNCGHANNHTAPAGEIADSCNVEGCNCAYYVPEKDTAIKHALITLAAATEVESRALVEALSCRLGYGHASLLAAPEKEG